MAGDIAAAQADGSARGFDAELAALRKLAGTEALGKRAVLSKRANPDPLTGLPAPLAARAQTTLAMLKRAETMLKRAETPEDVSRASAEAERSISDTNTFAVIKAATDPRLGKCYRQGWQK